MSDAVQLASFQLSGNQYHQEVGVIGGGGGGTDQFNQEEAGGGRKAAPISLSLKYSYRSSQEKMVSSDKEMESDPQPVNGNNHSPPLTSQRCPNNGDMVTVSTDQQSRVNVASHANNSCQDEAEPSVIKFNSSSHFSSPPKSFPMPLQGNNCPSQEDRCSPSHVGVPSSDPGDPESPSPPPSPDDSLLDSMDFPPPPLPQVDRPSALRLAKRLYNLEGFKKQDVSRQLSKKNDFSHIVAESYFNFFNFTALSLDLALRAFLGKCVLVGETQERERVLMYFSQRYIECNPQLVDSTFRSQDSLHTLSCAVVLLNTDLHNPHMHIKRMGPKDFVENLTGLNDGLNFPSDILYSLYSSILNHPLDWGEEAEHGEVQDPGDVSGGRSAVGGSFSGSSPTSGGQSSVTESSAATSVNLTGNQAGGINPFLTLPDASGLEYKKGYIVRKCCYDANGKKTKLGKRGWRMFYVTLRDLVLFCFKDEKSSEQAGAFTNPQVALRLHSALAHQAADYRKRKHVFRLVLADRAEFLFRTTNEEELDSWVTMINTVVSRYSSPPLPAACSSSAKFQRPLYPSSVSQLSLLDQIESHQQQIQKLQSSLAELTSQGEEDEAQDHHHGSTSSKISQKHSVDQEQVEFLLSEKERYGTYIRCLQNLISSTPDSEESAFDFNLSSSLLKSQNAPHLVQQQPANQESQMLQAQMMSMNVQTSSNLPLMQQPPGKP